MLRIIRDTAALIDFDKQLQKVREMQLNAVRDGRPMTPAELQQAEERAVADWKREYFCAGARMLFLPPDQVEKLTDHQDYQARQMVDAEGAILDAHRLLLSLPMAGAPAHDDPDPAPLAAEGQP